MAFERLSTDGVVRDFVAGLAAPTALSVVVGTPTLIGPDLGMAAVVAGGAYVGKNYLSGLVRPLTEKNPAVGLYASEGLGVGLTSYAYQMFMGNNNLSLAGSARVGAAGALSLFVGRTALDLALTAAE